MKKSRTFGIKGTPNPNSPLARKRFSTSEDEADKKPESAEKVAEPVQAAPAPEPDKPVAPSAEKSERVENEKLEDAPLSPEPDDDPAPAAAIVSEKAPAKPQGGVRVSVQVGVPASMVDRITALAHDAKLDSEYLAEVVIARTLEQLASDTTLPTDANGNAQEKYTMQRRRRSFYVDSDRLGRVRGKLDPLAVKPVAAIVRVIYASAFAASLDQVKTDLSK
ncbi:MAG: hypothetical protein CMN09_04235 [Roseobacter sp.]|jgi:hypothetical protein|nr:hypothetical protein [Roseobacter sp.]|tara:strand:+ start:1666 stop:2328 length:663 start_codon:yes stop_codon:yes gene_type:complete